MKILRSITKSVNLRCRLFIGSVAVSHTLIDFGEYTFYRVLNLRIGESFISHIYEGYVERKVGREQMSIQTIRLTNPAAHQHPVNRMSYPFLRYRHQKLRALSRPLGVELP